MQRSLCYVAFTQLMSNCTCFGWSTLICCVTRDWYVAILQWFIIGLRKLCEWLTVMWFIPSRQVDRASIWTNRWIIVVVSESGCILSSISWNYSLTHPAESSLVLLLYHTDQTPISALRFGQRDTCAVKYQAFVYLNHNARVSKSAVLTVYQRTIIQLEWHCIA